MLSSLKKLREFLGANVLVYLITSAAIGVSLFAVEIGFAAGIQLFLISIGIATTSSVKLPHWLPPLELSWVLACLISFSILRGFCLWAQEYLKIAAVEKFKHRQRERLLDWVFRSRSASSSLVLSYFGERMNHAAGVVKYLQIMLVQVTTSVLIGSYLMYLQPAVTLSAFLVIGTLALPLRKTIRIVRGAGLGVAKEWDRTQARLLSSIKNLLFIRISGLDSQEESKTKNNLGAHLRHNLIYNRHAGLLAVIPQVIGTFLICGIAFFMVTKHLMPPGALIAYFYLFFRAVDTVSSISYSLSNFIFEIPQFLDVLRWWEKYYIPQTLGLDRSASDKTRAKENFTDTITTPIGWNLKNISFAHADAAKALFENQNFEIPDSKTSVIIGTSGAGKSSLLGILLGEFDPKSGERLVSFNGKTHHLDQVKNQVLHNIGYVGPESFLVEGTIYQNLTYGLQRIPSQQEVLNALEQAECTPFIEALPKKLEHFLTEQGQGLSAGQKQRLCLARALLRKPKALILDEATANLDLETEEKLIDTLNRVKGQMTIISVTHRQGMLRIADYIIRLGVN